MTHPEFVTTDLPSGLLKVECYGRHGCEVIVEGVSAEDAEKLKAACSVMETGYLRIVSLPFACAKIIFSFSISFGGFHDFTDWRPVR